MKNKKELKIKILKTLIRATLKNENYENAALSYSPFFGKTRSRSVVAPKETREIIRKSPGHFVQIMYLRKVRSILF